MADSAKEFPKDAASQLQDLVPTATAVLSDPNTFFAAMPKQGGLEAPGAFALAMLVAEGAILAVLSLLTFQVGGVFASLIGVPILGGKIVKRRPQPAPGTVRLQDDVKSEILERRFDRSGDAHRVSQLARPPVLRNTHDQGHANAPCGAGVVLCALS